MSDSGGYISVRNWRTFQHYDPAKRTPPWIKNHTDLTSNDAYRDLPAGARGVLHGVWIEYARSHGALPNDTRDLSGRLGLRVTKRTLERLNEAGFIDFLASAPPLASASASRAGVEEEVEVEEESPYPTEWGQSGNENGNGTPRERGENPRALGTNPRAVAQRSRPERQARRWIANGLAAHVPDVHLEEVLLDEFGPMEPELLAELVREARKTRA